MEGFTNEGRPEICVNGQTGAETAVMGTVYRCIDVFLWWSGSLVRMFPECLPGELFEGGMNRWKVLKNYVSQNKQKKSTS